MALEKYFDNPEHQAEKHDLPLLRMLIERYADERTFRDCRVAFAHILVRNSMVVVEALIRGGSEVILSDAHHSPAAEPLREELAAAGVPVLPIAEAASAADLFMDVNAVLGRHRMPMVAAEVTRTGIRHYENIPCAVISADDCRAKRIEGFFGTGDGFVRAWRQLRPNEPLTGMHVVQFGYGKIGRGVARRVRAAGAIVSVVEAEAGARSKAEAEGFAILNSASDRKLQSALANAEIIISVTGVPGLHSKLLPPEWLKANRPVLVNLGAEDEFGPEFEEAEILGGKREPLNFHLAQPTLNRYVDPPLAAHVLALEACVRNPERYPVGIHPLPEEMDRWLITEWRKAWPDEDLTGIAEELGLG